MKFQTLQQQYLGDNNNNKLLFRLRHTIMNNIKNRDLKESYRNFFSDEL